MDNKEINKNNEFVRQVAEQKYEFGFTTDVHTDIIDVGLNEDVVRLISQKKGEPDWMLDFRLKAYNYWKTLEQPTWGHVNVPEIDYQAISYYADPLAKKKDEGKKEIDPELMKTFDKLGIPLEERLILSGQTAVDAIMDSVSVKTTYKEKLAEKGIIFCSIGEAIKEHPDLVREYLGTVVPYRDNFFAALNSAVFSDGSFVYIPKGVRSPMELSSYFRINARNTGQFERTLIIAEDDSYVSYLEGCTAPMRDENQLHAAIVEIIVKDNAEVKYSTVQNWYPGDENGKGGSVNSLFLHSAKMFFIRLNSVELFIIFVASYLCTPAGHRTTNAKTPIRDQRIALGCAYRRIYVSAEVRDSLTAGGFFVPLCVMCMDQFFIIGGRFSGGMYGYFRLEMYRTHANRCRHHRRV